jgi:hypothetical protein
MRRHVGVALLALGLAAPAQAYTLVMRGGDRVDIGDAYRLEGSRVAFAVPGGVRTLDLAAVDLDATARLNGDTPSAFVARATRTTRATRATAQTAAGTVEREAAVTVTNADLEPYRVEREGRDAEFAARHPEFAARGPESVHAPAPERGGERVLGGYTETEWRDQALALSDRVDAEKSQIDAIRDEVAYRQAHPLQYRLSYEYNFGNAPILVRNGRYSSLIDPGYVPLRAEDEFAQLNSRLIDLQIEHRATVIARDRFLERAREAGVPPGWVRE